MRCQICENDMEGNANKKYCSHCNELIIDAKNLYMRVINRHIAKRAKSIVKQMVRESISISDMVNKFEEKIKEA